MLKRIQFFMMALFTLSLTSCLDITEEVTYRANGTGSYTMKMDMSQMKGMLDMVKGMSEKDNMAPEVGSTPTDDEQGAPTEEETNEHVPTEPAGDMGGAADLTKMGEEFTKSVKDLKKVKGITNAVAINDTSNLIFGYTFDFDKIDALNAAINVINKDKFEGKPGNSFVVGKKSFERTSANDLGALLTQALSESEDGAESIDMLKMFLGEMKYKQIYRFERKIKKSGNPNAQISADGKTVTLVAKPFGENEKAKSVANVLKLK